MKVIKIILEIIGWLQIAFSLTFAAALIAFAIYVNWSGNTGLIIALIITSAGFIAGVIWATKIWIRYGTVAWLSRITSN